jgi:hypothetical protein
LAAALSTQEVPPELRDLEKVIPNRSYQVADGVQSQRCFPEPAADSRLRQADHASAFFKVPGTMGDAIAELAEQVPSIAVTHSFERSINHERKPASHGNA